MSDLPVNHPLPGLGYAGVSRKWGWFAALGIVLVLAGFFALCDVVAFTLVSVIFIGAMLLVGGVFQVVHALMTRDWSAFALNLLLGVLYIVGGFLIMDEPVQGSVIITIFLLAALLIGGVVRMTVALQHREMPGWWLMLLGGAVSVMLAVLLYITLPWSGLWVLGTLIGVELLVQGFSWLRFGLALRRMGHV